MPTYAFVDSITDSPTVLMDLDDQSPFSVVVGTQTPPPAKRYASSSSTSRDGDTIAQSSYADRVLTIVLRVEVAATAEEQVAGIQKLARLLDAEQWLMWKHDTMTSPVFFRTRRADMDIDDFMMVAKPKRTITLTIPAEPFAYGLPVTGSATIRNDPAASTNPMSYVLPSAQGDVASPLWLSYTQKVNAHFPLIASMASVSVAGLPEWISASGGDSLSPPTNWTITDTADAAWSGGNRRRITTTSPLPSPGNATVFSASVAVEPGDYRILMRAKGDTGSAVWTLRVNSDGTSTGDSLDIPGGKPATWFDFGVQRFPRGYPLNSPLRARPTPTTKVYIRAFGAPVNSVLDIDGVLLVPAGLDYAAATSLAFVATELALPSDPARVLQIDGEMQTAFYEAQTGDTGSSQAAVAGGFPMIVPGSANILHFVQNIGSGVASISDTTVVSWSYYPRYLYVRPATT